MVEKIELIITLVSSLIGVFITIYKIGFKKERKRLEEYYKKVLKPFIGAYQKNSNINPVKFLKPILKREDDDIPKYVFYLCDQKDVENLRLVLLYDYTDIYNNDSNTMNKIMRGISKILCYIEFFFSFFFLSYGSLKFVSGLSTFVVNVCISIGKNINVLVFMRDNIGCFVEIICAFIFFGTAVFFIQIAKCFNTDTYTLEIKRMKKLIKHKVNICNKKIEAFYF